VKIKQTIVPAYGDGVVGDTIIAMSVQCLSCRHLHNNMTTCKAFPDGIPSKILLGRWDHIESFKNDNGIRFEKVEGL